MLCFRKNKFNLHTNNKINYFDNNKNVSKYIQLYTK